MATIILKILNVNLRLFRRDFSLDNSHLIPIKTLNLIFFVDLRFLLVLAFQIIIVFFSFFNLVKQIQISCIRILYHLVPSFLIFLQLRSQIFLRYLIQSSRSRAALYGTCMEPSINEVFIANKISPIYLLNLNIDLNRRPMNLVSIIALTIQSLFKQSVFLDVLHPFGDEQLLDGLILYFFSPAFLRVNLVVVANLENTVQHYESEF